MMMITVIMNEGYLVGKQFEGDVEGKMLTAINDEGKKASSKNIIVFRSLLVFDHSEKKIALFFLS